MKKGAIKFKAFLFRLNFLGCPGKFEKVCPLKSDSQPLKKFVLFASMETILKMMKNAFYFILKSDSQLPKQFLFASMKAFLK